MNTYLHVLAKRGIVALVFINFALELFLIKGGCIHAYI